MNPVTKSNFRQNTTNLFFPFSYTLQFFEAWKRLNQKKEFIYLCLQDVNVEKDKMTWSVSPPMTERAQSTLLALPNQTEKVNNTQKGLERAWHPQEGRIKLRTGTSKSPPPMTGKQNKSNPTTLWLHWFLPCYFYKFAQFEKLQIFYIRERFR